MIVASRFEFEAGEYGVAIHQRLLLIAFQAHVEQQILADDLELRLALRVPSVTTIDQVSNRGTRISLHSEDFCLLNS